MRRCPHTLCLDRIRFDFLGVYRVSGETDPLKFAPQPVWEAFNNTTYKSTVGLHLRQKRERKKETKRPENISETRLIIDSTLGGLTPIGLLNDLYRIQQRS
jgi:hypothetical protein